MLHLILLLIILALALGVLRMVARLTPRRSRSSNPLRTTQRA